MFNFFRKKKEKEFEISNLELLFFNNLIDILPKRYHYLKPQITDDFLFGFKKNILGFENSYTFLLNSNLETKFINKNLPVYFILQNIKIWNNEVSNYCNIELDILNGMLGGFKIESINFSNFNFNKFDVSSITEKHFENKDLDLLIKNFTSEDKKIISENLNNTYEIVLDKEKYYFIDDIGNGDVLAMDILGNSYLLIHDPYKIKKLFDKTETFLKLKNNILLQEAKKRYEE